MHAYIHTLRFKNVTKIVIRVDTYIFGTKMENRNPTGNDIAVWFLVWVVQCENETFSEYFQLFGQDGDHFSKAEMRFRESFHVWFI